MNTEHSHQILSWHQVLYKLAMPYKKLQIFANAVGIGISFCYFAFFNEIRSQAHTWQENLFPAVISSLFLMVLAIGLSNQYLGSVRGVLKARIEGIPVDESKAGRAGYRVLNLPVVSAVISFLSWALAAAVMPWFFVKSEFNFQFTHQELSNYFFVSAVILISGIVTSVMVFFATELLCRPLLECFFPKGEFIQAKKVFRVKLWPRILVIFLMASLFPLTDMAMVSYDKAKLMLTQDPKQVLESLLWFILFLLAVESVLVFSLSIFMSRSIVAPILDLKSAMSAVENGNFQVRARVMDNNELGSLAQHFNRMTKGLKERYDLLKTLDMAREVQQNLLPDRIPAVSGLDLAGISLYCDQTGGDYYDFIETRIDDSRNLVVAVGDVSGHGIPSALLMASARAFLRQRLALPGTLTQVLDDVNVQFCRDVGSSGHFMTLFLASFDQDHHTFTWIRAGHDPALLYDPIQDRFVELIQGGDIPLGIDETFLYQKNTVNKDRISAGQILFIGTDGIWESKNASGERFGKDRIKQILQDNRNAGAQFLLDQVLEALDQFMNGQGYTDDVTLIIVKKM